MTTTKADPASPAAVAALMERVAAQPGASEWVDEACCRRYLVARQGDEDKAAAMLCETLDWRAQFLSGLEARHRDIRRANATGKLRVCSFADREGRPVLRMAPRLENCRNEHDANLNNLVYHMERLTGGRSVAGVPPSPDGKAIIVMDFRGFSMFNQPPMRTSRATLAILQNHYPERAHKFLLLHAPALFHAFYRAMWRFIDPRTREKIVFVKHDREALERHFEPSAVEWLSAAPGEGDGWDADEYFAEDDELPSLTSPRAVLR
ncbi:hypothetical protein EMIHUDRAFT_355967 [Emiliania huxleyi CCMP1516]|uniref:CRAL-TRIO domain-containing protein n=3 Tax=Emiliania huxleyi TaxID=2903 RepID=A0A0D3IZS7_EMIH1|nr:hypothetical protein EMIHUDRAFT_355967 [Emiliania huxleyi CCMP1516]EOD16762.1 hypothetical protein EMIHUDRAFT_355967 [Emiliania huxleyi CCMP1516]|eukprot:XP_005769191.1 hypothetical protein EMIHUDRAFT_355967 [Emiliania huxleyi CCMP1516]